MTTIDLPNHIAAARVYGISFILAFVSYGFGNVTIDNYVMAIIGGETTTNVQIDYWLAIISITLVHSLANMGVIAIMYSILSPFSRFLSAGYIALGIIATVSLLAGGGLLAIIPQAASADGFGEVGSRQMVEMLHQSNFILYQAGMSIWGIGGILMCIILWRTKLVPRWLPTWGFVGYAIFVAGTISEFFASGIGVTFSLPGGLFEIGLSTYLIIKGFDYRYVQHTG